MGKSACILIVDDDIGMGETLSDILAARGYLASVAEDGYAALAMAQRTPFDVALLDIRMPGMNGVEVYRRMKETSPRTRVIMMTAYAVEDLREAARQEGVYQIVDKPLDMGRMMSLIEAALSRPNSRWM